MKHEDRDTWRVIWTEQAVDDLSEIAEYISHDSQYYALAVVREIYEIVESLSVFPLRGRVVPEFARDDIRELFSQSHRIIYKVEFQRIAILAIIHFRRDMKSLKERRSWES